MKYPNIITPIVICMLAACAGKQRPINIAPAGNGNKIAGDKLVPVASRSLCSTVRLPGQLKPFEAVNIYPKINGFVKYVYVDRGSVVHKGQVLARLEAPEMTAESEMANAKYEHAKAAATASREHYSRLNSAAVEPGAVAQLDLDNALARMKADEAVMQSEQANVSSIKSINGYLTIIAPFDGVIVQRNVSAGALVGAGKGADQPMFTLEETQKLRLEVMVPEAYSDKISLGQEVTFFLNTDPGTGFKGKISRMANAMGNLRSEIVEIDIENGLQKFKPGMYAEVDIPFRSSDQSIVVPSSAIVRTTERLYVITARGDRAHLVNVKEGMKSNDSVIVFGDIPPGTKILLQATDQVKEDDQLNTDR